MSNISELYLRISGRVQGVGFRATAQYHARKLSLVGTARNLSDGSVEIIAQGTTSQLSKFIKSLETSFQGHISTIEKIEKTLKKQYDSFEIVH